MSPACGLWCACIAVHVRREEKRREDECAGGFFVLPCASWFCVDYLQRRRSQGVWDRQCDVTKVCFEILCGCQNMISRLFWGVSRWFKVFSNTVFHGEDDRAMRLVRFSSFYRQFHGMVWYVQFTYWLTRVYETWHVLSIAVLMQASNKAVWGSHFQCRRLYNHMEYV